MHLIIFSQKIENYTRSFNKGKSKNGVGEGPIQYPRTNAKIGTHSARLMVGLRGREAAVGGARQGGEGRGF